MYTSKKNMAKKVTQIQNNGASKDTKNRAFKYKENGAFKYKEWGI